MTTDRVFALGTNGRVYSVMVNQLPSARGDGQPITTFVELEAGVRIDHVFCASGQARVLFSTANGNGFVTEAKDLIGRTRQGKALITVATGDTPLRPAVFTADMLEVFCLSEGGRALLFSVDEVKVLKNGGRGVSLMGTEKKDLMQQALVLGKAVRIQGSGRGSKVMDREFSAAQLRAYAGNRARKGRLLEPRIKNARMTLVTK